LSRQHASAIIPAAGSDSVQGEYDGILHQDVDGDGTTEWLVNCFPQTLDEDRGRLVC